MTVWVASTKPYAVLRIDPSTNKILTTIKEWRIFLQILL